MAEKGTRQKRYSEQFRLQAAKLIVEGGYTCSQASQRLGVSDWALLALGRFARLMATSDGAKCRRVIEILRESFRDPNAKVCKAAAREACGIASRERALALSQAL